MAQDSKIPLKIIAGADDFGSWLKDELVEYLRSLNIDVEEVGTDNYYSVGEEIGHRISSSPGNTRGLVACGTGVGVGIFANKFPGVFAATCTTVGEALNARSINNCNVLAVSGMFTDSETGVKILDTWLKTPFKSPCPASGNSPWPPEIEFFLSNSVLEMSKIGGSSSNLDTTTTKSKSNTLPETSKNNIKILHSIANSSSVPEMSNVKTGGGSSSKSNSNSNSNSNSVTINSNSVPEIPKIKTGGSSSNSNFVPEMSKIKTEGSSSNSNSVNTNSNSVPEMSKIKTGGSSSNSNSVNTNSNSVPEMSKIKTGGSTYKSDTANPISNSNFVPEMSKIKTGGSSSNSNPEMSKIKTGGSSSKSDTVNPIPEMSKVEGSSSNSETTNSISKCSICDLGKGRKLEELEMMPGAEMKIVRESPTSAIVRFKAGSVEPAHHHTFGHDVLVMKGSKRVWNLTKKEKFDLGVGDFLFTPAGDVHRVKYLDDTDFFIRWDGGWDIVLDESLSEAHAEIAREKGKEKEKEKISALAAAAAALAAAATALAAVADASV